MLKKKRCICAFKAKLIGKNKRLLIFLTAHNRRDKTKLLLFEKHTWFNLQTHKQLFTQILRVSNS